jgi:hypothetical protein
MKINMKYIFLGLAIFTISLISYVRSDSVCIESVLVTELIQDIRDNGKLDCLRKPLSPPTDKPESEKEKKNRLEAAWDTDCAFEADYDWLKPLKERYGLKSGLVDKDGKSVET